ncbi:MAG: T9SS type A sorting domain-containing protein [Bacteroidia bacterium]
MKYALTLFVLLTWSVLISAQNLDFSTPGAVADDDYGYTRPRVVMANMIPLVVLNNQSTGEIFVARWNGSSFDQPVKVTPEGVKAAIDNWMGPDIASNGDDVYVIFKSEPEASGYIYVVHSSDGGKTFGDTMRVNGDVNTRLPSIAVLGDGNPVVMFMQFQPNFLEPEYVVAVSTDKGRTFSDFLTVSDNAPGEVCDCCPAALVASGDTIAAFYRNNDNNIRDAWIALSTDGGKTFPMQQDIDENNWNIFSCPSTGPDAVFSGGKVITSWMSGAAGNPRINFLEFDLGTQQTSATAMIHTEGQGTFSQNYPRLAAFGSHKIMAWQDNRNNGWDVWISHTTNSPFITNKNVQQVTNESGFQFNPDVAINNEKVFLVWQEPKAKEVKYVTAPLAAQSGISSPTVNLSFYPNPAEPGSLIQFEGAAILSTTIFDARGKVVWSSEKSDHPGVIPTPEHPGIYILRIKFRDDVVARQKLVVR